jgi:HlyD family secretion protein
LVGTLERDRIELLAESSEPIVQVLVREGDRVKAGQPLVELERSRLLAMVNQAQGTRDQLKARLDELIRGPRKEQISEARAKLLGAEAVVEHERREFQRNNALYDAGATSAEVLDASRRRIKEAESNRDQVKANLAALENGTTAEELAQGRAAYESAEAALAAIKVQYDRLLVLASRDGQIDALPYKLGERPTTGAVLVVMLAANAPYARVYVPETIRSSVKPGVAASVHVDGVKGQFAARVRTVSHDAAFTPFFALTEQDRGRLAYVAEIDLVDAAARELPTGLPVQVTLHLAPEAAGG